MSEDRLIDNQFVEIVTPQAPVDTTLLFIAVLCILLTAIIVLASLLVRRNAKNRAARKLRAIQQQNKTIAENYRQLAFDVAAALRLAFHVTNLESVKPAAGTDQQWQRFRLRLSESCYGKSAPSRQEIDELVVLAHGWLRNMPASKAGAV